MPCSLAILNSHKQSRIRDINTKDSDVPEVVVLRLPLYVRVRTQVKDVGTSVISSQQLGQLLQMTPAQIRKDLSYFGRFGKPWGTVGDFGRGFRNVCHAKKLSMLAPIGAMLE